MALKHIKTCSKSFKLEKYKLTLKCHLSPTSLVKIKMCGIATYFVAWTVQEQTLMHC